MESAADKSPQIIQPMPLKRGDAIAVMCTGGPPDPKRLAEGVAWLEKVGFRVIVGETTRLRRGYLAGSDEQRAGEFNRFIRAKEVNAIFFARGGYGSLRLLPLLDYDAIRENPKALLGYSDLTCLLNGIYARTGMITFHGPMVATDFGAQMPTFTEQLLWAILGSPVESLELCSAARDSWQVIKPGCCSGRLVGGCLSLLTCLMGTSYMPSLNQSLIFIEEIREEPYRIDRMLHHLKIGQAISQAAGVVIGSLRDCVPADAEPSLALHEVFDDVFAGFSGPVVAGLPFGHQPLNCTLPIGGMAWLDSSKGLYLTAPAVALVSAQI